jgi:hypothetical protein
MERLSFANLRFNGDPCVQSWAEELNRQAALDSRAIRGRAALKTIGFHADHSVIGSESLSG